MPKHTALQIETFNRQIELLSAKGSSVETLLISRIVELANG